MTYTVQISSRGTITIPKSIRESLGTSQILIMKENDNYVFKPIPNLLSLGKSIKPKKALSDEDLDKIKSQAFIRKKTIV